MMKSSAASGEAGGLKQGAAQRDSIPRPDVRVPLAVRIVH